MKHERWEDVISQAWITPVSGVPMFQVCEKTKAYDRVDWVFLRGVAVISDPWETPSLPTFSSCAWKASPPFLLNMGVRVKGISIAVVLRGSITY